MAGVAGRGGVPQPRTALSSPPETTRPVCGVTATANTSAAVGVIRIEQPGYDDVVAA